MDSSGCTLVLFKDTSDLGGGLNLVHGFLCDVQTSAPSNKELMENERTFAVLYYVGFTEESSQAWLRNFLLVQIKNGKSPTLHVPLYLNI